MSRRSQDRARSRAGVAPPSQPSFLYNSKQLSLIGCRTLAPFARVRFLPPLRRFSTPEHPFATSRKEGDPADVGTALSLNAPARPRRGPRRKEVTPPRA